MWIVVFAIGRPIGTGPSPGVTRAMVDQIVVSVGPYMFHTAPARASSAWARSRGKASPPHRMRNCGSPCHPASISPRQVAGVACITLGRSASINSRSARGSAAMLRGASSSVPPASSGRKISSAAMSNDSVVTASI